MRTGVVFQPATAVFPLHLGEDASRVLYPKDLPRASHRCHPWAFPGPGPPPGLSPQPYQAPGAHYVAPGTPCAHTQQQPFSNTVKQFSNWNVCYSCGFDVKHGHTSMSCPAHLHKASHDIYFTRQNTQQYIDLGHPCSTRNRHKTTFPPNM